MSRWTAWRKIAEGNVWYDGHFDYEGAACYELGVGGPRTRCPLPVYLGETGNEKLRIAQYARGGSHLSRLIDRALRHGYSLYYRAQAAPSKQAAKQMQDNLLERTLHQWNGYGQSRMIERLARRAR